MWIPIEQYDGYYTPKVIRIKDAMGVSGPVLAWRAWSEIRECYIWTIFGTDKYIEEEYVTHVLNYVIPELDEKE